MLKWLPLIWGGAQVWFLCPERLFTGDRDQALEVAGELVLEVHRYFPLADSFSRKCRQFFVKIWRLLTQESNNHKKFALITRIRDNRVDRTPLATTRF